MWLSKSLDEQIMEISQGSGDCQILLTCYHSDEYLLPERFSWSNLSFVMKMRLGSLKKSRPFKHGFLSFGTWWSWDQQQKWNDLDLIRHDSHEICSLSTWQGHRHILVTHLPRSVLSNTIPHPMNWFSEEAALNMKHCSHVTSLLSRIGKWKRTWHSQRWDCHHWLSYTIRISNKRPHSLDIISGANSNLFKSVYWQWHEPYMVGKKKKKHGEGKKSYRNHNGFYHRQSEVFQGWWTICLIPTDSTMEAQGYKMLLQNQALI